MGRRVTSTTKGGKFMNPTDQARKEARRRELRKNKKQRSLVRQAVIKTKDPRQMLAELDSLDEMELNPLENLPYNDKVVKEKRIKLLENVNRIVHYYLKEDPDQGRDLKRILDNYRKDRLKKEVYYESVRNAQRVKIDSIPLPDDPFQTPQLNEIPLPGLQPHSILKKPQLYVEPMPQRAKAGPPGPPPGPPPAKKKFKGNNPAIMKPIPPPGLPPNSRATQEDVRRETKDSDGSNSEDERSDEEFQHRDDDFTEDSTERHGKRKGPAIEGNGKRSKVSEDQSTENPKITPLQAAMLKLAGQDMPKQGEQDPNADIIAEDDEDIDRLEGRNQQQRNPPGPPPGLPPGPPRLPPEISGRMQSRIMPPGPPPGLPPTLPPGPPPGLPPNIPHHRNASLHQSGKMMKPGHDQFKLAQQMENSSQRQNLIHGGGGPSNVLSAPPSLIQRRQEGDKEGLPTMIVAKPKIINNPKADVTRFMPTSLRVKRQGVGKSKPAKQHSIPSPSVSAMPKYDRNKRGGKVNADVAYDSFMKEMQGLL